MRLYSRGGPGHTHNISTAVAPQNPENMVLRGHRPKHRLATDLTQENDKSFLAQFSENRDRFIIILGYHFAGSSCYNSDWKRLTLSWVIILQGQVVIILTGKSLSFFGLSFWSFTFFCEKRSIYHFAGFDSCWNSSYFEVIILQVRIIYVSSIPVLALLLDFRAFLRQC